MLTFILQTSATWEVGGNRGNYPAKVKDIIFFRFISLNFEIAMVKIS